MASNDNYDDKPNLRPTKRQSAGGKTIFLHHNPNQPSNKSYIHAVWGDSSNKNSSSQQDPFGIERPHVEYSLNKQQRWEVLTNFREHINNYSSSSSDDELGTQSDTEQKKKKLRRRRKDLNSHQTKYRLQESHNIDNQANCVKITSNTGEQKPKKTYMQGSLNRNQNENPPNDSERSGRGAADVTYYAVVPPPKDKQLSNIRKQHGSKGIYIRLINIKFMIFYFPAKKTTGSTQRSKFTQVKDRLNATEQLENDNETSSDDEDLMAYVKLNMLLYFI